MKKSNTTIKVSAASTIRPSTQSDIDSVETMLRPGDLRECEIFGGREVWHQDVNNFEQCWTIEINGALVGYCGVAIPPDHSPSCPARWLSFLSTVNVNKMKVSFVRESRAVLKAIVAAAPAHVTTFLSMPMADYRGSDIWHRRVLKMHEADRRMLAGHEHIVFLLERKEV